MRNKQQTEAFCTKNEANNSKPASNHSQMLVWDLLSVEWDFEWELLRIDTNF